jgi:hypothetical protein
VTEPTTPPDVEEAPLEEAPAEETPASSSCRFDLDTLLWMIPGRSGRPAMPPAAPFGPPTKRRHP